MRIVLAPGADIAALVRTTHGDSLVVLIDSRRPPLELALARAAIAPLAIERAPGGRVNAVVVGDGADPAAVEAAVAFLDRARSTTGQILEIS